VSALGRMRSSQGVPRLLSLLEKANSGSRCDVLMAISRCLETRTNPDVAKALGTLPRGGAELGLALLVLSRAGWESPAVFGRLSAGLRAQEPGVSAAASLGTGVRTLSTTSTVESNSSFPAIAEAGQGQALSLSNPAGWIREILLLAFGREWIPVFDRLLATAPKAEGRREK